MSYRRIAYIHREIWQIIQILENIYIAATSTTPAVRFEDSGKLAIEGRSQPGIESLFYEPLIEWAGLYQGAVINLDINLDYMNSMSSKKLLQLFRALDDNNRINELTISWYYETDDEETLERGLLYEELLKKATFVFHELSESFQKSGQRIILQPAQSHRT